MTNPKSFEDDRKGTGTKEWSDESRNIGTGCKHNCAYCYARYNALNRWRRIKNKEAWVEESINLVSVDKKEGKVKGVIMFPTTHDITPFYLPYAEKKLFSLLKWGNKVLIVTKPHFECIKSLCKTLAEFKANVMFRFSIGTLDDDVRKRWESGAPAIYERLECLLYAFKEGYQTSVSAEPLLPNNGLSYLSAGYLLYNTLAPMVTDKIWIGKMNKIDERVIEIDQYNKDCMKQFQNDYAVAELVRQLKSAPKIAWKDSIKQIFENTGG